MTNMAHADADRIATALERIADVLEGQGRTPTVVDGVILDGPPRRYVAPLLPDAVLPDARYVGDHQP